MTIDIKGLEIVSKKFHSMYRQIDYASMLTLNNLAFDARESLNKELGSKLRVRQNTSKAFVVDKAKKSSLSATVRMKRDWHYLSLQHYYQKKDAFQIGFERSMIARGYMTDANSAIPVKKMGKAKYRTIIDATKKGSKSKYFVVKTSNRSSKTKHLHPGIYQRMKRKVKPIILFTAEAQYKQRFNIKTTVEKVVSRRTEKYFFKNLDKAMRTAR